MGNRQRAIQRLRFEDWRRNWKVEAHSTFGTVFIRVLRREPYI